MTHVGDIAIGDRIANIDDGSYPGTFRYYAALRRDAGRQLWLPGHGLPSHDLLDRYELFLRGIWEPCLQAVKDGDIPVSRHKSYLRLFDELKDVQAWQKK